MSDQDPYAAIAKPAQSQGASADPYASIAQSTAQPGFLDKEISLTPSASSFGGQLWDELNHPLNPADMSGIQSIGRGIRSAYRGIRDTFSPTQQPGENLLTQTPIARIGRGIYQTGKQAAQVPSAIHDINQSADPVGTYAKVGQETAGQGAGQAITALATEGLTRGASSIARPAASRLYQSALKPSTTLGPRAIGDVVSTGLNEKIPVSEGGLNRVGGRIGDVNQDIADTIAKNPSRSVNKFSVASRLGDTAKKFGTQVNPEADLNSVSESGNEFLRNQPGQIPGPDAQALKQGTYRAIGSKAYGEMKGASLESQKALARGLKEELAKQYPELNDLNARDSRLINLQDALETAVARSGNREPLGVGGPMIGAGVKIATGNTPLAVTAYALKQALRSPAVRSKLAIALNGVGKARGIGASTVGASALGSSASDQPSQ